MGQISTGCISYMVLCGSGLAIYLCMSGGDNDEAINNARD